ncbi:subtilisin family serine protease [Tumebacillus sp. BK434]|uniref:S8 family serine peptidase n=1 Tax=Tumebacillus sp. BK434 TaxID=2512169 RepID=UPI0010E5FAD1|nr:S8 family serine peptidase [Tumebacillus sp. BK434]TCP52430.1 subtilisin family serine protease [Tumebacillus sp. BK434]
MNRRAKWGVITALTLGLMVPFFWHDAQPDPIRRPEAGPAKTQGTNSARTAEVQRILAKKTAGNEHLVARDIARTAALCVRDCRIMLTDITNDLAHTHTAAEKRAMLQHHLQMHPQFVSMTLHSNSGEPVTVGRVLRQDLHKQAYKTTQNDDFYVSDLYTKKHAGDPKEKIAMTVGVPVVGDSKVTGSLSADVEMGYMNQIIALQDREMGTDTRLLGMDGKNEMLKKTESGPNGNIRIQQLSRKKAEAKVDGTAWKVHVTSVQNRGAKHAQVLQNELVVRFTRDLTDEEIKRFTRDISGTLLRKNSRHTYLFSFGVAPSEAISYFKRNGAVIAEQHVKLHPNTTGTKPAPAETHGAVEQPNDMFYGSNQWNLPLISADKAWQTTTGDPHVIIAVVDTGVDLNHPEFKGQLVAGRNMLTGTDRPQDDNGHGTHVAGVIAARTNNLEGIAGIDWAGKIMPVKAMDADGSGSVLDIADGIIWAADHGADVINLSLGEYAGSDYLHEAIRYAYDKGVVLIAAMGNDGISDPSYPAAYEEVIGVAANDENKETATFSNYGQHTSVSAPGVAIPSTYPNNRYAALSGTSMASPHVAGVAALIRSINKDLTPQDVRTILEETADDLGPTGPDEYYGYGQINVARAIKAAVESKGK